MRAARGFAFDTLERLMHHRVGLGQITVDLYGSLGATGIGHGTDRALLLGLEGAAPESVDPTLMHDRVKQIRDQHELSVGGEIAVSFNEARDVRLRPSELLPGHPNGMHFTAYDTDGEVLHSRTLYSVGGGFVVDEVDVAADRLTSVDPPPRHFRDAAGLLARCRAEGLSVAQVVALNEDSMRPRRQTTDALLAVWEAMQACVLSGCTTPGTLPGLLAVTRRAPRLYEALLDLGPSDGGPKANVDTLEAVDWLTVHAIAVNEENAAGGRVVTAPTNGAAGIIPAVLHYYWQRVPGADEAGVVRFLLAAAAIGIIVKENASISGAEVGCQGEVGSACAMAAAGLCEVLGGSPEQVENAAEIALEHNLGLTCDPVGGLVQIPCIERNAVGAVKAVTAVRLALRGDGTHRVSFDQAVETLRTTGADMSTKYKETSTGGLAVNVTEC